jgi:hypothetical protein
MKLIYILKEILLEFNKSQLDFISNKLNINDKAEFQSLMNSLNSQDIKYQEIKNKIEQGYIKDINDLKKLRIISKTDKRKEEKKEADIIYNDDRFLIIVPHTYTASCYYTAGTKWCITKDSRYWEYVLEDLYTFYFIIDKTKSISDPLYKIAIAVDENGNIDRNNFVDAEDNTIEIDPEIYLKKIGLFDKVKFISRINQIYPKTNIDRVKLKNIVYKYGKNKDNDEYYKETPDGITVDGDIWLNDKDIDNIPFKFFQVKGDFLVHNNRLGTLKNSPIIVGGNYNISNNNLNNLKYAPKHIKGNFIFRQPFNDYDSFEGFPKKIDGYFNYGNGNIKLKVTDTPEKIYAEYKKWKNSR